MGTYEKLLPPICAALKPSDHTEVFRQYRKKRRTLFVRYCLYIRRYYCEISV